MYQRRQGDGHVVKGIELLLRDEVTALRHEGLTLKRVIADSQRSKCRAANQIGRVDGVTSCNGFRQPLTSLIAISVG